MGAVLAALALAALPALGLSGGAPPPPAPSRSVTDLAGVFTQDEADALNDTLTTFGRDRATQIVVWIDRSLPQGQDVGTFARDAFDAWGIGRKDDSKGVLFVVFTDSRAARIQVGPGMRSALSDARAAQILREQAVPEFRDGNYAAGVEAGAQGILRAARAGGSGGPAGGLLLLTLVATGLAAVLLVARWRAEGVPETVDVPDAVGEEAPHELTEDPPEP